MPHPVGLRRPVKAVTILAVVIAMLALSGCDWSMWRGGPGRTGSSPETVLGAGNVAGLKLRWSKPTENAGRDLIAAGGLVYTHNAHQDLTALDARTGAVRWTGTGDTRGAPAVADGVLYVATNSYTLQALDAATGVSRWIVPFQSDLDSPLVANGVVYTNGVEDRDYALDAFNAADGTKLWTKAGQFAPPAYADGLLYVDGSDGVLRALDPATGVERWHVNGGGYRSTPTVDGGSVYINDSLLRAFDARTGKPRWAVPADAAVQSVTVANGVVYYVTAQVHAVDATTGAELWHGSTVATAPVVTVANGVLYMAVTGHELSAFDAKNGAVLWSGPAAEYGPMSELVLADGVLYVAEVDRLVAFGIPPAAAALRIAPTDEIAFGTVPDRTASAGRVITVTNIGAGPTSALTTTVGGAASGQFKKSLDGCSGTTLAAGASCSFTIAFAPSRAGQLSAQVGVSAVAGGSVAVTLSGVGYPFTVSPESLDFGSVFFGRPSAPKPITVTNVSSATAVPTVEAQYLGSNFGIASTTCGAALPAGGTCIANVRALAAEQDYGQTGDLYVHFDGIDDGYLVDAHGYVAIVGTVKPWLTISGSGDLGNIPRGTTKSATFTVTNAGPIATGPINVDLIPIYALQQQSSITSNPCQHITLAHGASCTVVVTFAATTLGGSFSSLTLGAANTGQSYVVISGTTV